MTREVRGEGESLRFCNGLLSARYHETMDCEIEFEQEEDGRWIAEIPSLPGVMAYGASKTEAESKVEAMALRVIADQF